MSNFGVVITQNKNAKTASSLEKIIDNTKKHLKAFKQGFVGLSITGSGIFSVDITHGLGYAPVFFHLGIVDPANPTRRFLGRSAASGPGGDVGIDSYIDKEVLKLSWQEPLFTGRSYPFTITFYYYIFYDSLEDL